MSTNFQAIPQEAPIEQRLPRVLGPITAMAVVVGNVIGSGIFAKPAIIASQSGSFPLILSAWIVGGIFAMLGGLALAELAVMLPAAGGPYVYLREAYGKPVAFLFGWTEFLFSRPAAIGALAVLFVDALANLIGWRSSGGAGGHDWPRVGVALLVIGAVAWINILGAIWGGRMQAATTALKVALVALVGVLPFALWPIASNSFSWENYNTSIEPPLNTTVGSRFGLILLGVMWAYDGWHGLTPVAEEVRNPSRNIPIAIIGGISLLILLYLSAVVSYHGVLPMDEMAALAGKKVTTAEVSLERLLGPIGLSIMAVGLMISTLGAMNANLLIGPRISFAMGRDGVFFRKLGHIHASYRSPAVAIAVTAVMSGVLVLASGMASWIDESYKDTNIFDVLTNFVIFAVSGFYLLAILAVPVLRWRRPNWNRPYRVFGYPWTCFIFVVGYAWFLMQIYKEKPVEANSGAFLILLGIPAYFGYQFWTRRKPAGQL